jgi:PAS domain S-box-containing protein
MLWSHLQAITQVAMKPWKFDIALRITLIYGLFAGLWILLSDRLLFWFTPDITLLAALQTLKGWLFVLVSACLLYFTIRGDLESRQKAETALREGESRLTAIIESAMDGIITINAEQKILLANPAAETMFGYSAAELIGESLDNLIPQALRDAHRQHVKEFSRTGLTTRSMDALGEVKGIRKNGEEFPIEASISQIEIGGDGEKLFNVILRDITSRKRAEEQIQQKIQRLSALRAIDIAISSSFDLQMTLEVLLDQVISQLKVDATDVLLWNLPAKMLEYAASRGFQSAAIQKSQVRLGRGYAGRAISEYRTIHVSDLNKTDSDFTNALEQEDFVSYYGVPLIAKGQIKGVLEVYHRTSFEADNDWLGFLEALAGEAAIAIDDAQLFDGLQRSNSELNVAYDATIEGWSRAMDLRDRETEGHTQRVTELTLSMAQAMRLKEEEMIHIRRGGLLHDIGKLGVPDNILFKREDLTDVEWEIMRKHPTYAYEMLSSITYLKPALDIPYCHHEKWNGSGYPRGLKGKEIPLVARIFAVVDVWDAVTSDRPYRPAWTKDRALDYIQEQSGKYFDPEVVDVFLRLMTDK